MILLTLLALAFALFMFYKWFTIDYDYFKKRDVPYILYFATAGRSMAEHVQYLYNKFAGAKVGGCFVARTPVLFIRDPETLKQLAIKDFDHFEDHRLSFPPTADELAGNSLLFLQGEKWRDMRSTLSPAFTGNKMRQMLDLIVEIADEMTQSMRDEVAQKGSNSPWEVKDLTSRFTNDAIATAAFGVKVNSMADPENDFMQAGERLRDLTNPRNALKFALVMYFPYVAKALGVKLTPQSNIDFFKPLVFDMMAERERKNIFRPDMINILMQVRKGTLQQDDQMKVDDSTLPRRVVKRQWTDNELLAQALIFFGAGFQPVSDLLTFAIYELTVNPQIQERLHEEIEAVNDVLNGKPLKYDNLKSMTYLDQVVSETLRKWPPNPIMDRECTKDYILDLGDKELLVRKGMAYLIPIFAFHHDPQYFPEPDVFDPERFNEENKKNIVAGTYIPFGLGPRMCIGNRLALMKAKAFLYYLLLRFKIEPNAKTEIPLKLEKSFVGFIPSNGIHVDFIPRSK